MTSDAQTPGSFPALSQSKTVEVVRAAARPLRWLPWLVLAVCWVGGTWFPEFTDLVFMSKDAHEGAGYLENLTVVLLAVAVAFGVHLLMAGWALFPVPLLRAGILAWIMGCIYFAGEEVSWGQWWFGWETPEWMRDVNRQEETNLHNISGWLNQKPRTLIELWMLFAGLAVPLLRRRGRLRYARTDWREWINPAGLGVSTCVVFLLSKAVELLNTPQRLFLGSSETREALIALFLLLYLLSVYCRLHEETAKDGAVRA